MSAEGSKIATERQGEAGCQGIRQAYAICLEGNLSDGGICSSGAELQGLAGRLHAKLIKGKAEQKSSYLYTRGRPADCTFLPSHALCVTAKSGAGRWETRQGAA